MKVKKLESIQLGAILTDNIWLNLNENLNDPAEKVPLEDSESVVSEYNVANLKEIIYNPIGKVFYNINSSSDIPKLPNIKVDSVERVPLKESESVAKEDNDTNLNESINDPGEKVYYNINSNSVSLRLSDIKIDVPLEKKIVESV